MVSKITVFFKSRLAAAEELDIAFLHLAFSDTVGFDGVYLSIHPVRCWHITRSSQCGCEDVFMRNFNFGRYQYDLNKSTLAQRAITPLLAKRRDDYFQDHLDILVFFLSLSETSQLAIALARFVDLYVVCLSPVIASA